MKQGKLIDPVGAQKFLQVLAGNAGISVHYEDSLATPYATSGGAIHLPVPTIENLDRWNYQTHHEVSHCFKENRYHFEAMGAAGEGKHIMNIVVDNLAERHEFTRYEGRRKILSEGRLAHVYSMGLNAPCVSREDELIKGLFSWESNQRKSWMGFPFETITGLPEFPGMFEYFESIELATLMDEQTTKEDLLSLVDKILKWLEVQPNETEEEDEEPTNASGSDTSQPDGTKDTQDGQTTPESEEPEESGSTSEGVDKSAGDTQGVSGTPEDSGSDNGNGLQSDRSQGSNVHAGDKVNGKATGENTGTTERPSSQEQTNSQDSRGANSGTSEERGCGNGSSGSDKGAQDDVGSTQPIEGYKASNVSEEAKRLIGDILGKPEKHKAPLGIYKPLLHVENYPLLHNIDFLEKGHILDVIGSSVVGKSIQKYLQVVAQKSYAYGLRSGQMYSRSAGKAASGAATRNIFKQRNACKIERDTALTILVDCSGSMSCHIRGTDSYKDSVAFGSITIMGETLKNLGIPYEVLGYTEALTYRGSRTGQVLMINFKSYQENLTRKALVDRFARCPRKYNNADAESLLQAANSLNKRKEKKRVLVVLSDGNPIGHFDVNLGKRYLKKVAKHIEDESNLDLLAIGIGTDSVRQYYKNSRVVMKVQELDKALMELLKSVVSH